MLASGVPSQDIARSKTYAIIGQGLDFTALESNDENEDLTEVLDGSAEDKMFLRKHLLAEAKSYRELEALTESLDYMETVTSMGYLLQEYDIIVPLSYSLLISTCTGNPRPSGKRVGGSS
jgi:nuclear pore complex protein Nup107